MRNLREDLEEVSSDTERNWVRRQRRQMGLAPNEGSCWFVETQGSSLRTGASDSHAKWLGHSPGDALSFASTMAEHRGHGHPEDARRTGTGRWTLEVYGDGISGPDYLVVAVGSDEEYFVEREREQAMG